MQGQQLPTDFTAETLAKRVLFLEAALATKDAVISEKDAAISEKDAVISDKSAELLQLSAELAAEKFKYAQLQRMIYGSTRERFISSTFPEQLKFEFEPKALEIEQAVEAERETIRIEYERKKGKKKHPGRLALPSHLPVVETIMGILSINEGNSFTKKNDGMPYIWGLNVDGLPGFFL